MTSSTNTPTDAETSIWQNRFYMLLAGLVLWRLLFLFISPLDLSPDEAYYRDWARFPSLGYYSKPPMIAYINVVSNALFGSSTAAVRFPALVFGAFSLYFIYALTKRMFDEKTAFFAAAISAASPGNAALNYIMTIDAPLVFFWSLSLLLYYRILDKDDERNSVFLWAGLTVSVGFGILSKQMMLAFSALMVIYPAFSKSRRDVLKNPRLYLSILLSAAFLLPVLYWNMQSDWITVKHTAHHFESHGQSGFYFLQTMGDFLGSQLGVMTPVIWILLVCVTFMSVLHFRKLNDNARYLLLFGSFFLVFFFAMSIRQRINPNWPAVFYLSGLMFLSAWYTGNIPVLQGARKWFKTGLYVGAVFAVGTYALIFAFDTIIPLDRSFDPTFRLKGWKNLGNEISEMIKREETRPFLMATQRQVVSETAFYTEGQPRVYKWTNAVHFIDSQYDLWPGPHNDIGRNGLLIVEAGEKPHPELMEAFSEFVLVKNISVKAGLKGKREFDVYRGVNLKKWPRY